MLYPDYFLMCAYAFNDILKKLAIYDTAVEQGKLNRMIDGASALALHGIDAGGKPEFFDVSVYQPTETQLDYLAKDVPDLVCGITGKQLPIPKMRELNVFVATRKDVSLRITLKREETVPAQALLFRYGATFYRVQGVNNIADQLRSQFIYANLGKVVFTPTPVISAPSFTIPEGGYILGQEFLDEPLPADWIDPFKTPGNKKDWSDTAGSAAGYSVETDLITIRKKIPAIDDADSLKRLFETYVTLRSCNKIDTGTDSEMILLFHQREKHIADNDPEG